MIAEWKSRYVVPKSHFNEIRIDNKRFIENEGENPISSVPYPNPNFGKIFATSWAGDTETVKELKIGDVFYPIRVRVSIKTKIFDETDGKSKPKYTCKEVDRGEDVEIKELATSLTVFTGPYKDAKEKYQLRYRLALYVYREGTVYRWEIGGQEALGSWFGVEKAVQALGVPHTVKIADIIPQKNNTIYWNDLKFAVAEPFPVKDALALDDQLRNARTEDDAFDEDAPRNSTDLPFG